MNIVLGIESSNSRGMGHLFRSLLYVSHLDKLGFSYIYLINNDEKSIKVLKEKGIDYVLVDYSDKSTNWEADIIQKYNIDVWFNDKFETSIELAKHVKQEDIIFACLDDVGEGAFLSDIYFAGFIYPTDNREKGKINFLGKEYFTLNQEINKYTRVRNKINKILVSMGGSDPFCVTIDLLRNFQHLNYDVTFLIGPNFSKKEELLKLNNGKFKILQNVPSFFELLSSFDFAITGGGLTCCEVNASGVPSYIIANADHEVNTGKYVESLGGAKFLGKYDCWDSEKLNQIDELDIEKMSLSGLNQFDTLGIERIITKINDIWSQKNGRQIF